MWKPVLVDEDVVGLDVAAGKVRGGVNFDAECKRRNLTSRSSTGSRRTRPDSRRREDAPVDEAELVDGLDGEDALGHVEARDVLGERVVLDEHRHEVAAGEELHQEVEVVGVLERVVQLDDPGRVGLGEDVALGTDVGELRGGELPRVSAGARRGAGRERGTHLVLLEHLGLFERLHGVDLARVDLLDEAHLAERALADDLYGAEVVEAEAGASQAEEARLGAAELGELALLAVLVGRVGCGGGRRRRRGGGDEALFEVGAARVAVDGLLDGLLVVVLELELCGLGLFERVLAKVGAAVEVDVGVRGRGLRGLVAKEGVVALLLLVLLLLEVLLVLVLLALSAEVLLLLVGALVLGDERGDGAATAAVASFAAAAGGGGDAVEGARAAAGAARGGTTTRVRAVAGAGGMDRRGRPWQAGV